MFYLVVNIAIISILGFGQHLPMSQLKDRVVNVHIAEDGTVITKLTEQESPAVETVQENTPQRSGM